MMDLFPKKSWFLLGLLLLEWAALSPSARAQTTPTISPRGTDVIPAVVVCVDPTGKQNFTFTSSDALAPYPKIEADSPPWSRTYVRYVWNYDTLKGAPESDIESKTNILEMNRNLPGKTNIKVRVVQHWEDKTESVTHTSTEYSEVVPFIVVKVEYKEFEPCSGFDESILPHYLMVPYQGVNQAKVEITPEEAVSFINFESESDKVAAVKPEKPTKALETITVSGLKIGSTEISSKLPDKSVCEKLGVDVKKKVTRTIAIHAVTEDNDDVQLVKPNAVVAQNAICVSGGDNLKLDTKPGGDDVPSRDGIKEVIRAGKNGKCETTANNTDLIPEKVPTAEELKNYLNQVWGKQANAFFTVTRSDFDTNYDLNLDGKLADPKGFSLDEVRNIVKTGLEKVPDYRNSDFHIFYVKALEVPAAVTPERNNVSFVGDLHVATELNVTAHEVGHLLGLTYESLNPKDLMFYAQAGQADVCVIRRKDWNFIKRK